MSFYKFLFTLTIIFLFSTCAEKPTEVTTLGSIYGVVNDESNNNPLPGATVNISEIGNRITSANGAYEFDELEEDVYSVTASKAGYVSVTEQVEAISNKNKEVNFYLRVAQPAQLLVSPQSLNFGQTETSLQLTVDNGGDVELSWQVSSDQSWLTTFPTTGTTTSETDEITVSVNRSLLDVGNYTSNLSFTSNGGDLAVPVAMEVTPVGLIVSTNALDFGETESQISFTISNSGTGELNWSISTSDSWITVSPISGTITTNSEDVAVSVERSDLTASSYDGSISIESNGGNLSISVSMIVPDFPAPTLDNPYNITENSMILAWSVITHDDFQEYRLYRSTSTGVSESSTLLLSTTNENENTFNDDDLDDGTTYYYRVYSVNNYGVAVGSNEVYATTVMGIGDWGLVHTFDSDVYLEAIHAFSDDNIWVAGYKWTNGNPETSIIYHYAGGSWIEIIPPNIGEINDIDFSSENNGWAVGGTDGWDSEGGVLYYDGISWDINDNIPAAHGVDVNSADDIWFIDNSQGGYHYINGNYNQLGISGWDIQVEDDFGVIITRGSSTSIESYIYNGFSWVDGGYITYAAGTIFGKPSRLVMIDNENIYITLQGTSKGGVFYFDGSEWSTFWGGNYDHNAKGIAAQFENSVWFYGTSWITWYIMHWDGNSVEEFDSQGIMNDIHFFEPQTGWSCGDNNVFRYN